MFHGSVPDALRRIVHEHAGTWNTDDIYVGCSGNFTLERVLHARDDTVRLHGNDITAYSCALGWFLEGRDPLPFTLKEEHEETLGWLKPSLATPAGTLATLMLGTRLFPLLGKDGAYYQRMVAAYRDQWEAMHTKTTTKLEGLTTKLASFYPGDVRDFLTETVPADAPVVMFPPFYAADYQAQFAAHGEYFDWSEPNFRDLDEDGKEEIIDTVRERDRWVLGLHIERPEMRENLHGVVQTANRGLPIYVYAAKGPRRIVRPRQDTEPIKMAKIGAADELGDRLSLHVLTGGQFAQVRSQFMSKTILPGSPLLACGVAVDGKLVGAFAWLPPKFDPESAYLMSDFPVSWSKYRRLSKLIVMAAISTESQQLLQRALSRRLTGWSTTAFTDRPNSAKYGRGIPGAKLTSRTSPAKDGIHQYQLQYGGPLGQLDLADTLALWKTKHGKDLRA